MGLMHKAVVESDYVQIPNDTARAPETTDLSLQALGLLVNLWSYPVEKWVLHKTELYKRFTKNKETSVRSAFKELVDNNFMIEVKYRKNGRNDYDYVYRNSPFTEEEKAKWIDDLTREYGEISTLDFQDLKNQTSKSGPQKQVIIKNELKKDGLKKKGLKKEDIKPFINDDEEGPVEPNIFAFKEFIFQFQKNFPNKFDNNAYNSIWEQMHIQGLKRFTYKEAVTQARYMQQRIDDGKLNLGDYASYFVGGILRKRSSEKSAILQEKAEKAEKEYKAKKELEEQQRKSKPIEFYNWLDQ